MLDHLDELELLGLIEGELDAQAESALRRRLASEPQALALVDQLRADRAALRSIEEPELPVDFPARLEPILARPMLIESETPVMQTKPGEFRRQHRRQTRRIRWSRLAVAAVIMIGVPVGFWMVVQTWLWPGPKSSDLAKADYAALNRANAHSDGLNSTIAAAPLSAADGAIHHHQPDHVPADRLAFAGAAKVNGQPANDVKSSALVKNTTPSQVIAADFAVVITSINTAAIEDHVQRVVVTAGGESAAFVRNFSFAEARRIEQEWRLAQARRAPNSPEPLVAGTDPQKSNRNKTEINLLADRVRQQLTQSASSAGKATPAVPPSGVIAGSKDREPTLEQQLDFSSRGAAYTIAVPASQLNALVQRLNAIEGQSTALQMLSARAAADASTDRAADHAPLDVSQPMFWLTQGPQVRQSILRLTQGRDDAVVLVPVIVRPQSIK